jgi:hypothetical protein
MNQSFKSMILVALASSVATFSSATVPSGTIFTAKSPEEVCNYLDEALVAAESLGGAGQRILIAVDVDDTLIRNGSDVGSFSQTGNFGSMEVINLPLVRKLHELEGHPFINSVAVTSATTWGFEETEGSSNTVNVTPFLFSEEKRIPLSEIRANAMKFLGMPFAQSFGNAITTLPFIMQGATWDNQPSPEVIPTFCPLFLDEDLVQAKTFSGAEIFSHSYKVFPRSSFTQNDFYAKDPIDMIKGQQIGYAKILACPVHNNGVIFSNFLDSQNGYKKGLVVRSFLQSRDRSEWPVVIIAIDDNLSMHKDMKQVCLELGILFFGIYYVAPGFWIFARPTVESNS